METGIDPLSTRNTQGQRHDSASLLLILAIALIDIAKLFSPVGGLALALALEVYDSIARAGGGPRQAQQGQSHETCDQYFCPQMHLFRNCC